MSIAVFSFPRTIWQSAEKNLLPQTRHNEEEALYFSPTLFPFEVLQMSAVISQPPYNGSTFRTLLAIRGDRLSFLQKLKRDHGDVVRFHIATQAVWMLSHPDHIRDVLVVNQKKFMKGRGIQMMKQLLGEGLLTSEGETHLRQRRLVQPAFHRQRVASYATSMVEDARKMRERWTALPIGEAVEMSQEMMRLTLVIAGKTLFDTDVEDDANEVGQALTDTMNVAERIPNPLAGILARLSLSCIDHEFQLPILLPLDETWGHSHHRR